VVTLKYQITVYIGKVILSGISVASTHNTTINQLKYFKMWGFHSNLHAVQSLLVCNIKL